MTSSEPPNLFEHPLATADWELVEASPVRTFGRAVWRSDQSPAVPPRIVHARAVQGVAGPLEIRRLGVRRGVGYHKCASAREFDAPARVRLLAHRAGRLEEVLDWDVSNVPAIDSIEWCDTPLMSELVVAVVEQASIDRDWPSWNLARTGLVLEGAATTPWMRPRFELLDLAESAQVESMGGMRGTRTHDLVRFRSPYLEVAFRLRSPSLAHLAIDGDGTGATERNLLQQPRSMDIVRTGLYPAGVYPVLRDALAPYLAQGPRLTTLDGREPVGFLASDISGTTTVQGNTVTYDLSLGTTGVRYRLRWTVEERGLELDIERDSSSSVPAWTSSAWHFATDVRVTPSTVLGHALRIGETGLVAAPATWHFPGFGSMVLATEGDVRFRSDVVRPLDTNTLEVKLDERSLPDGSYELRAGRAEGRVRFDVRTPRLVVPVGDAPAVVARALDRHLVTAMTFRPDTDTFSNNGASMHCAGSLNLLSEVVAAAPSGADGVDPRGFLEASLSRWLRGAPGYGSGHTSRGDFVIEDEYLMLGADALFGLGRLLSLTDERWFEAHHRLIERAWRSMRRRDVDDDGLIESNLRQGRSGEHQWSTTWADVMSFGWKDAWSNAVLYAALQSNADGLRRFGRAELADELAAWAVRSRAAYSDAFVNPDAGWIGGWRSPDGRLHDYCFPLLNGDAVASGVLDAEREREVMSRVWDEFAAVGYEDFANGIPMNLHPVAEEDIGGVVFGLPIGGYLQGGASHHRAHGFLAALYRVGMEHEADRVLEALASTVADDSAFGGVGSGRDWRLWDGSPSGYEGLLAEGFGFLAMAIRRWAAPPSP